MSLFAELGPAELEQVASWFDVEERDSGATLTQQGASGYAFYVLRDGRHGDQGDEEDPAAGAGGFFGELSIIGDGAVRRRSGHVHVTVQHARNSSET
jgi:hypothetical protein